MSNRVLVAVTVACLSVCASAGEIFVDAKNGKDGEGRGSESAPYLSIQAAVNAAKANDIITLFPGDYTNGVTMTKVLIDSKNRVVIDKKLTIRSKEGRKSRDVTRIVGAWDADESSDRPYGMGPNAVRCVWVTPDANGVRFEGLTFMRGSTPYETDFKNDSSGGGIMFYNNSYGTIVDCAFIECQAGRGGGLFCGKTADATLPVARTLFKGCRGGKFGYAMRGATAYNCVFDDNRRTCLKDGTFKGDPNAKSAVSYIYRAVNCTFVNNELYGSDNNVNNYLMNCVFANNSGGDISDNATGKVRYCVNNSNHTDNNCISVAFTTSSEVYSPMDGDYRLVKGARAVATGSMDYVAKIAEEFRTTDYFGNSRTTDGKVNCGAVQEVAEDAASGIAFTWYGNGDWYLDGKKIDFSWRTFVSRKGWPVPYHIAFVPQTGWHLVRYIRSTDAIWPMMDDSAYVMAANAGQVQTMTVATTDKAFWVDPKDGNDDNDGSSLAPFRTLNHAVNAHTDGDFVVYAKAGDYNSAGETYAGIRNRVVVKNSLKGCLRVKALSGAKMTFITGASDSSDVKNGLGKDAIRCVAVASTNNFHAAFQGFTLRNGRSIDDQTSSGWESRAGGFHNTGSSVADFATGYLLDCVIRNCKACRGAANYGGVLIRCRVEDCAAMNAGVSRSCGIYSSLYTECTSADGKGILGASAIAYSTTLCGNGRGSVISSVTGVHNSILSSADGLSLSDTALADGKLSRCLYNTKDNSLSFTSAVQEDPVRFWDPIGGDFHLRPGSGGCRYGRGMSLFAMVDVEGRLFDVDDEGRFVIGCFADRKNVTRYVDADDGDDGADGTSEETAFRTLAKAMEGLTAGDKVIALPGVYDNRTMLQSDEEAFASDGASLVYEKSTVPARVVLKPGVTLESRDGAETTIIEGAENTRCVFLGRNAVLRGFTVRNGDVPAMTVGKQESNSINDCGAGVHGYAGKQQTDDEWLGLVENCIIRDCKARCGSGARYGTYRNCKFIGNVNKVDKPGYAARDVRLIGCYFEGHGTRFMHSTIYLSEVRNCTVMDGQAESVGAIATDAYPGRYAAYNTLVLGRTIRLGKFSGCVFSPGITNTYEGSVVALNCQTGDVTVAENGVPLQGSIVIDAGDEQCLPDGLTVDIAGTPRVLNGCVDVGAYEYDWRADYSKALAKRRVTVTDVPPNATLVDGKLAWSGSGLVGVNWESGGLDVPYEFTLQIAGTGTLTVCLNGETFGTYAAGIWTVKFGSSDDLNRLTFMLDGDASVLLSRFVHMGGLVIVVQ